MGEYVTSSVEGSNLRVVELRPLGCCLTMPIKKLEASFHHWADSRRGISFRLGRGERAARGGCRVVISFCLAGLDQVAGRRAINYETGPSVNLYAEVERIQWLQHVDVESRGDPIIAIFKEMSREG